LCGASLDPRVGLWNIKIGKKFLENSLIVFEIAPIRKEKSANV